MNRLDREALQRAKDALFHALQSKNTLRHFLRLTYDATGLQLAFCDTSFCVLAAFPPLNDEKHVETIGEKQHLRFGVTLMMEQRQHIRRLMENLRPSVSVDAEWPYPIMFQAVRINQAVVAYLFSPGRPEGFSEEELELIDYLSQILSIELQKSESVVSATDIKFEYFLSELLDGRLKSDQYALSRLGQLKRQAVKSHYHLVSFSFDDAASRHSSGTHYFGQLMNIFPEALVGQVKRQTCMLLPREALEPLTEQEELTLLKFLEFNRMRAGFSYRFTSLLRANYAWEQAEAALMNAAPDQRIRYYEQNYLSHLFSLVGDGDRLETLVHPDILLLRSYDREHNAQYLSTLGTFLMEDRNAVRAAAALYIHKSTFFFRMGKIAELLGKDIMHNSALLFDYELSFHLLGYLKAAPMDWEEKEKKA